MRVAIDVSQIVYGTGVSTYTKNLVENLIDYSSDISYSLFAGSLRQRKIILDWYDSLPAGVAKQLFYLPPDLADILWNKIHLFSVDSLIGEQDILHSSDWTQPSTKAMKVTTIHDLAPVKFPEYTPKKIIEVHNRRLAWVKKEVNAIIVPSLSTRTDLLDLGFDNNKINVIPEASDKVFKKSSESRVLSTLNKFKIKRPFLLSVGSGPRKNTERLLKAFGDLREDLDLVITGRPAREYENTKRVRFVGYVNTPELVDLYSGAEALVYPTLYEGFGLPILDAYSVGCPVVTSNVSSLAEVAGDAAILVDPHEIDSIGEGIKKCLRNRETLIKKGNKIAKNYSWKKTAEMTINVYNKLIS